MPSDTTARRHLPVLQSTALVPAPSPTIPPPLFVSRNDKTGFSVNVSIEKSCRPTVACSEYCYGRRGPIAFGAAVRRQTENFHRLNWLADAPPSAVDFESDGVAWFVKPHADFLRFFGVGDLQLGSVRLISNMARRHPELQLWVATRKFDLARRLPFATSLHVMLGLDSTTKGEDLHAAHELVRERSPQYYGSWVRRAADEVVPKWVEVIFAVHKGAHRAKWSAAYEDVRLCMATKVGGENHADACSRCRRCFDTGIRTR